VRPFPANHTNFDRPLCVMCHRPGSAETTASVTPLSIPEIPHLVEGQEDQCLDCHIQTAVAPFPDNHKALDTDTCLLCHQIKEASPAEGGSSGRPEIPHPLERREDCLLCHSLDGIKPFPANHEDRGVDKCQVCHKPEGS
jgi:hypothetical protein